MSDHGQAPQLDEGAGSSGPTSPPSQPSRPSQIDAPLTSRAPRHHGRLVPVVIGAGAVVLCGALLGLYRLSASRQSRVALAQAAKPVSVVKARGATFRPSHSYVATVLPWTSARVGPQFVSAYVGSVLVRPGARVRRGEVLATLDCRESSAASREVAARARALDERQRAAGREAERFEAMKQGGFASTNEAEQLAARSRAQAAELDAARASLTSRSLEVDDCVLRAPFAGEVSERAIDPGAYVRPGSALVTIIDRTTVRVVADAPETDFAAVAPGTRVAIEFLASGVRGEAPVSRRAPAADEGTRTVHFEIDVPNADLALPVGTTAVLGIDVGEAQPATTVPLRAATVRGGKASVFVVDSGVARRVTVPMLGELRGALFVKPELLAGAQVVVEGRALLDDGDAVAARVLQE